MTTLRDPPTATARPRKACTVDVRPGLLCFDHRRTRTLTLVGTLFEESFQSFMRLYSGKDRDIIAGGRLPTTRRLPSNLRLQLTERKRGVTVCGIDLQCLGVRRYGAGQVAVSF